MRQLTAILLVSSLVAGTAFAANAIGLADLLEEMTDLERLTETPDPPFTCRQFSSYDRASKSPEENWFANGDAGHFLRVEEKDGRKEHVMMDAEGPGAIVRIWSANPKGVLRIYIDGAETPALEMPMEGLLSGNLPEFPRPIAGVRSAGWNLYFPIPYRSRCRVTSDDGGFYYHVNYRTYPQGTDIESFSMERLAAVAAQVKTIAAALAEPRAASAPTPSRARQGFRVEIAPGAARGIASLDGPAEIVAWTIRAANAVDEETVLCKTVVEMTFDGTRCVEVPLGDFFGTAPGLSPYESLVLGVTNDGEMWSHWPMPFRRNTAIVLRNHGSENVRFEGEVVFRSRRWTPRSCHFRAVWKGEYDIPTRPHRDWTFVDVRGAGRYVGNALYVANPHKGWWGEGDEKIYVDGETFPSHFGTGSEDYYGYAWCNPAIFQHAYHNQPRCDGPGNYGHTAVNRWHVLDSIPFTSAFRFDMEVWHHAETTVSYEAVSFYYGWPGSTDSAVPIDPATLHVPEVPEYAVARVPGAIEGEGMRIMESTGNVRPQDLGSSFSGERHLWWTDAQPGDRLVLSFNAEGGNQEVLAHLCSANDYGIVKLWINDEPAGEPIDLYNEHVAPRGPVSLGSHELNKGRNTLAVEIVGANPNARPAYMFGLDYILLK